MSRVLTIAFLLSFLSPLIGQETPTIFSVEGNDIPLSEFNYIYNKNNGDSADYTLESLENYLDLYVTFKLKVQRAKEMGLDTIQSLKDELGGYKKQLAQSYLKEKEVSVKLIDEVINRMSKDREVSHIFVSLDEKAPEAKKKAAKDKIDNIYKKLAAGADFEEMVRQSSEDKASVINGGALGYYVAPLPNGFYNFENTLYATKIGEFSKPLKSKMGYHILKVTDERPARGEMEVSHILFRNKKNGQVVNDIKTKVEGVYEKLKNGAPFEEMAKTLSEDSQTAKKSGYLGFFGINQFEKSFEDAAYKLSHDGEISKPIETRIGWHIIKRKSKRDNSDVDALKRRVKSKIAKSDRFDLAEKALTERIKKEANFKENLSQIDKFTNSLNEDFYNYKWKPSGDLNQELMSFGSNAKYSLNDFAQFCQKATKTRLRYQKTVPYIEAVKSLYESFVAEEAIKYEEANLENKYPDFKSLMQEYQEGILLFEATKLEVWDKASNDEDGLLEFHQKNQEDYHWKERAKVVNYTIRSSEEKLAKKIYKMAKKEPWANVLDKYNQEGIVVSTSDHTYEIDNKKLEGLEMKKGDASALSYNEKAQVTTFRIVEDLIPAKNKTLDEARGYIIADYQDFLEKEWVKGLKEKYKVEIFKNELKRLTK